MSWTYDAQGRVTGKSQTVGTSAKSVSYGYTNSNLTSLTTPSGQSVVYGYDTNHQITSIAVNGTNVLNSVLYDPFGPVRGWSWGNGTIAARTYDTDGNVTQIDSGGLKTYSYDDAFRITGIADEDNSNPSATYGYDLNDRLTSVNLSITQQLPAPGISLGATSANPGQSVLVSLTGDPAGLGYWFALAPVGAPSTTYVAWTSVPVGTTGSAWNPSMPSFAGTYEVRLFAPNFQLVASSASITVSAPTIPSQATLNVSASYAGTGNSVTVRLNNAPGGSTDWLALAEVGAPNTQYVNWVYVGNGVTNRDWTVTMPSTQKQYEFRLFLNNGYTLAGTSPSVLVANAAAVAPPLTSQTYAYDSNGNRTSAAGTTYTRGTGNRLASLSGALVRTYSYDAAGNVLGDGIRTFTYSNAGRLRTVTFDGVTTTYTYNALGERVKKASGSSERHFVYDESGHLLGEYDGTGALIQETVWLGDIPVATLRPNGAGIWLYYVHTDHLNTPRVITRPFDNAVVWRWDSNPFGDSSPNENPQGVGTFTYNLRFPGQYFDAEGGTSYNFFRNYDSTVGRYLESDPLGLTADINSYAYVSSNPISGWDPLGLADQYDLGGGYTGRVDRFNTVGGQASFELHVYKSDTEVGILGPNGWLRKHGHTGAPDLPKSVDNACNGIAVNEMRMAGHIPEKGKMNIKGGRWKRFLRGLWLIGPLIEETQPSNDRKCEIAPNADGCYPTE